MPLDLEPSLSSGGSLFGHKRSLTFSFFVILHEVGVEATRAMLRGSFLSAIRCGAKRLRNSLRQTLLRYHQKPMKRLLAVVFLFCLSTSAQEPKALPQADERYKADILVVVEDRKSTRLNSSHPSFPTRRSSDLCSAVPS